MGTSLAQLAGAIRAKRRRHRAAWVTGVTTALGVAATAVGFAVTPSVADAPDRVRALAQQHRTGPPLTALPDKLRRAVLAVEDHRFYRHQGFDGAAVLRTIASPVTGEPAGGATIEMQLAKWLYTDLRSQPVDQAEQVILAMKLDRAFAKSQVLLMYLNTVYFGHGFYGAAAAAEGYFGVPADQLDWPQAALLAGLLQAPGVLDPREHPTAARSRRDYVLSRLVAVGTITPAVRRQAAGTGLELAAGH